MCFDNSVIVILSAGSKVMDWIWMENDVAGTTANQK